MSDTAMRIFGIPLSLIWAFAPLYGAYKDFENGDFLLAFLDYAFFPLGLIRGIMFALGW